jgi:predicted alpha/beta superfamily hydrolase
MKYMGTCGRIVLLGIFVACLVLVGCPLGGSEVTSRREGRYLIVDAFPASRLDNTRRVSVFLPDSYDVDNNRHYPVLYMHDGQNLFHAEQAASGIAWEVDESVDYLVSEGFMGPIIVVGIDNTPARVPEYTSSVDRALEQGGLATDYAHFVVEEVKPWVDAQLRTLPDRERTGLAGSSLGGLVSLYMLREYPEVFGRVGCLSTSLWWNEREALGWADAIAEAWQPDTRMWLDVGTAEGDDPDGDGMTSMVVEARDLREQLLDLGLSFGEDLGYLEAEGDGHNETAWAGRFPGMLHFLFGTRPFPDIRELMLRSYAPLVEAGQRVPLGLEANFSEAFTMSYPGRLVDFEELTPEVLSVDEHGYLIGRSEGIGAVSATIEGVDQMAECQVEVVNVNGG